MSKIAIPEETKKWFNNYALGASIFIDKYALREQTVDNTPGTLLEFIPPNMWHRLAWNLANMETTQELKDEWFNKFSSLFSDWKFVAGGRINAGVGDGSRKKTPLNCYLSKIRDDSIDAIFTAAKEAAKTYSYGGGWGTNLSPLRPRGSVVNNASSTSTGAVSFMYLYDTTTAIIGQDGRRGALMLMLRVDHPDIFEFVSIKSDATHTNIKNANISVQISDAFMQAVLDDTDFDLVWKRKTIDVKVTIKAKKLWDKIIHEAWAHAEPGLLFWDTIKRWSPTEYFAPVEGVNPCSEQALEDNGACCLGSVNMTSVVKNPFSEKCSIDYDLLKTLVEHSVRLLDNVIDYAVPRQPLPNQSKALLRGRRIGLGVMGLADMLCMMRTRYDSPASISLCDKVMDFIKNTAYQYSSLLAKEKGTFLGYNKKKHLANLFIQGLDPKTIKMIEENGLRNSCILSIAPTGSISNMIGVSGGMEPIFALNYVRRSESLNQKSFEVAHPLVAKYFELHPTETVLPDYFVDAHSINPFARVKVQAAIQKHVDSAISSTVNLPKDAPETLVGAIYMEAWKAGLKGITVYVDGSRDGILQKSEEKKEPKHPAGIMSAHQVEIPTPSGKLYLHASQTESGDLHDVFLNIGKSGANEKADAEAIGRLISLCIEHGCPVDNIIKTLSNIKGSDVIWQDGRQIFSLPDGVAKALKKLVNHKKHRVEEAYNPNYETCPVCGQKTLEVTGGCACCKSPDCAYSKCT